MTTSFTTNFRIPIPDFMSEPWHAQLQAAIQAVDGLVYKALVAVNINLWLHATTYNIGNIAIDPVDGSTWLCKVGNVSASGVTTFAQDRAAHPTYWAAFVSTINPRGAYANNTTYAYYDLVYDATLKIIALCTTAYTSGAGPANLNTEAANWAFLAVFPVATTAASISYDHTASGLAAITAQAAIDEDHADLIAAMATTTALTALVATKAPLASPALTGNPTAPTQAPNDNSTKLSTTAYAAAAIAAILPISSANIADASILPRKLATSSIPLGATMINGAIIQTQNAGAHTFTIKTLSSGGDPSTTDPVYIIFGSTNPANGGYAAVLVTAALSITIPSGQGMGFTNNTPGRVWFGALNNAGSVELFVINCLTGTNIYPLQGFGITTTQAVAGAANSGVLYSTTARANLTYTVLGYATWEVGGTLATAGTWNALATRMRLYQPGFTPLPGTEIQRVRFTSGAVSGVGATVTPVDDTIPQNTEGDQYMASPSLTPISSANVVDVVCQATVSNAGTGRQVGALFQDATANAIAVDDTIGTAGQNCIHHLEYEAQLQILTATVFKFRSGNSAGNGATFNGTGGARLFGGAYNSFIRVREIQA